MDAGIKTKWIEALRGGKFPQGAGYLFNQRGTTPTYCCLGVLCEIQNPDWNNGERLLNISAVIDQEEFAAGLTIAEQQTLAGMNDNGKPFHAIADYIEKHL